MDNKKETCSHCAGCGKVTENGEPWVYWEQLPLASSAAVLMGLVKPVPCAGCDGTGLALPERTQE